MRTRESRPIKGQRETHKQMGNRANIKITEGTNQVFLYTHWDGIEGTVNTVADVLASPMGQSRKHDPSYLTRIMFDHLTKDSHGQETGYGIWPEAPDNSYPIVTVDVSNQIVGFSKRDDRPGVNGLTHAVPITGTDWDEWCKTILARLTDDDEE